MTANSQTTLLERLWASDEASALTNEAAREIIRLRSALEAVRQCYLQPESFTMMRNDLSRIVCEAFCNDPG